MEGGASKERPVSSTNTTTKTTNMPTKKKIIIIQKSRNLQKQTAETKLEDDIKRKGYGRRISALKKKHNQITKHIKDECIYKKMP